MVMVESVCERINKLIQALKNILMRRSAPGLPDSSISVGSVKAPLYSTTIPEHFTSIVARYGDSPAVICRSPGPNATETVLSYRELDTLSTRLAINLASLGVRKGDRIAISSGNGIEFAAVTYGLYKLGAILVPLNPSLNSEQVSSALNHLGVKVLIICAVTDLAYKPGRGRSNEHLLSSIFGNLREGLSQNKSVETTQTVIIIDNRTHHPETQFNLEECQALTRYEVLVKDNDEMIPQVDLDPLDTITIQFTSGTTSMPKAAMLSHHSIINNAILIAERMGLEPDDRIVVPPPLFHCFGSVLGYLATATTGAAILFPSPAFDPDATLKMAYELDATGLYGVTTMMLAILDSLNRTGSEKAPKYLRKGIVAGSTIPQVLMKSIYTHLGLQDLVICYGMTETSPVSCMTSPSDSFEMRCSSIGKVMPHTTVKIVDPSNRARVMPRNMAGELATSGYLVMKGYYDDPERTEEVRVTEVKDSTSLVWMYSGDEAQMDDDGYISITGRIKDLIIRGGENVHPLDIENCLLQLPGIMDAAVVGIPDDRLGEAIGAFVVLQRGWSFLVSITAATIVPTKVDDAEKKPYSQQLAEKHIRDWVKTKLSSHLVPKYIFSVEDLPKTTSGKIQKFQLRVMAAEKIAKMTERK